MNNPYTELGEYVAQLAGDTDLHDDQQREYTYARLREWAAAGQTLAAAAERIRAEQASQSETVDQFDAAREQAGGLLDMDSEDIENEWHALGAVEAYDHALQALAQSEQGGAA